MPHVIIEYSDNLSELILASKISNIAHNVLIESGLFTTADIKTRAYSAKDFLVGEKGGQGSFVHVAVYIMEGRSPSQKQTLSVALRDTLCVPLKSVDQLSVDIRELSKETYRKYTAS